MKNQVVLVDYEMHSLNLGSVPCITTYPISHEGDVKLMLGVPSFASRQFCKTAYNVGADGFFFPA